MRIAAGSGVLLCGLMGILPCVAWSQAIRVGSPTTKPEMAVRSLTLSASPSFVNFNLVSNGVAAGSSPVQVTAQWGGSLCIFTCTVSVYGYFVNANAALSGGAPAATIPSAEVLGRVSTGTPNTFTPFSQSAPMGGGGSSLLLFRRSFFLFTGSGSMTQALDLEIDLRNQPELPAGAYTGTLFLQAQSL